jgi:hypothetical protein
LPTNQRHATRKPHCFQEPITVNCFLAARNGDLTDERAKKPETESIDDGEI